MSEINFECPHCNKTIKEDSNKLPFEWICYYCGSLYSIIAVEDKDGYETVIHYKRNN